MKANSKYQPLLAYLTAPGCSGQVDLSFAQVEQIIAANLPASARRLRAWWSNRRGEETSQAKAWLSAGYRVVRLDLAGEKITFRRYELRLPEEGMRWGGDDVHALRLALGLSQAELATMLGVRQRTISEWERGCYQPSRAMSRYLLLFAKEQLVPHSGESLEYASVRSENVTL